MNLIDRIKTEVPKKPGCYVYFNVNNDIIYVGKAKDLRSRMLSYFRGSQNLKTQKLVNEIYDFKNYITKSENESLILERNLIAKYAPRYNILLKDDKSYPYILVTKEKYSRVLKVRDKKKRGEYFGPFPNVNFVNDVVELVNKENKLRVCKNVPNQECLYYHIDQCYGPCINPSDETEKRTREDAISYFKNNMIKLKKLANAKMYEASEKMDFENAKKFRDIIIEIEANKKRQAVQLGNEKTFDVISYHKNKDWIAICIVSVVDGVVNNIHQSLQPIYDDYQETVVSYLFDYYNEQISVPLLIKDKNLSEFVSNILFVKNITSHLQEYRSLEEIADENALLYFNNNLEEITKLFYKGKNEGFKQLQKLANNKLNIIEMFDISHHQGSSQVGGKVVYVNGVKTPKLYRKYKIKLAKEKDEYGSLKEILTRRLMNSTDKLPDLILLDGGKQQMNVAIGVLENFKMINDVMLLGLVKDDKHKTKAIVNKNLEELTLDKKSELYKFLFEIQEEVHRYAIDYHNVSQKNALLKSELDNIDGIGEKRKRILYEHFGTIENIKNASVDQLLGCKIPKNVANTIHNYFKNK